MLRKTMMVLSLLFFAALLSGCNSSDPNIQLQLRVANVPDGLRRCMAAPGAPKWPFTQRDVASYIVKLRASRDDCADKLEQVSALLKVNEKAIADFNAKQAKVR